MSIAFDLSTYLEQDLAYVPWSVALDQLFYIDSQLAFTDTYPKYKVVLDSRIIDTLLF